MAAASFRSAFLCLLAACALVVRGAEQGVALRKNPIRKVVNMLQEIKNKVTKEGEEEEKAFKEFMCYCKTGVGTLEQGIEDAKTKIATMSEQLTETKEKLKMTEEDLKEHQASREEAKQTVAKAMAIREQEAKAFAQEKSDSETNISAIKAAVATIEKGMGASFIQSPAARVVSAFVMEKATLADAARQEVLAFLTGSSSDAEDYAPKGGQIAGILKETGDEMVDALEEATKKEEESKVSFDEMIAAKTKEINALTAQIEEEMLRVGELKTILAGAANDLEETEDTLKEDQTYLAELKKGCSSKEGEWEERSKVRTAELAAIADTIKILNDDDALELFKKTLPSSSASFLQVQRSSKATRAAALSTLRGHHGTNVDIVMLAIQGKKIGFDKVIELIDEMVGTLKKEQVDDDKKKEYCEAEIDKTEDQNKDLERGIEVSQTAVEELKGAIATWTEEIAALKASIRALDASVAEATKIRKEQNGEYKELAEQNKAAKEVLLFAKNRLNKFYNPKLYKPEALAQTAPQLVQVFAHARRSDSGAAPPPPPETFGAYTKKSEEGGGVIAMIDKIVTGVDVEMKEAEVEEKDAQEDYEQLMSDAGEKRTTDSKALTEKSASLAKAEEALQAEEEKKKGLTVELMESMQVLSNLHAECDWLLKYFDVRKAARAEEVDALGKAKDVLSGADFSLLQTGHARKALV